MARQHSSCSFRGKLANRTSTAGSMTSDFFNFLSNVLLRHDHQFSLSFQAFVVLIASSDETSHLLVGDTIFLLCVLGRPTFHGLQRNDRITGSNKNRLAARYSGQQVREISLGFFDRERFHECSYGFEDIISQSSSTQKWLEHIARNIQRPLTPSESFAEGVILHL